MAVIIPFPRHRCATCGHVAGSCATLEAHYEDAHPGPEDPRHPDHAEFMRWRAEVIGR